MAIKSDSIGENFTNDQNELIALYEKQIDNKLVRDYIEGKELSIKPKPYPHYNWKENNPAGCDEKVVNEILRKYRQAGWLIKWYCSQDDRSGTWYFVMNKIEELSAFKGKRLKISFTQKDPMQLRMEHTVITPILGACKTKVIKTKVVSETEEEYMNFCIPPNLYITDDNIIKFVRYYNKDNRWSICLKDESPVLENLKVEII